MGTIREFMKRNFHHFNARETRDAAQAWVDHLGKGGKMMVTIAGAMSTAELGISLAPLIRAGKVHAITCTGANLEEDIFNLIAHDDYEVLRNWRELSLADEKALYDRGMNRVTDTCIPETALRDLDRRMLKLWQKADKAGESKPPYQYFRELLSDGGLKPLYQIPPEHSWVLAAHETNLPVFVPGWEDSTLGNIFASHVMAKRLTRHSVLLPGTSQMEDLARWYKQQAAEKVSVGFFQLGGGIAGDFPICVVPMLIQDLEEEDTPFWGYFAQIGDSTTSYGSYSGAFPSEKITWGKLDVGTPAFMINSDASIVAPLIFAYVMDR
jgi:deoxyhypusine synthase